MAAAHAPQFQFVDLERGRIVEPHERLGQWDTVAYVILSYKLPDQVARLVETIKRESPRAAVVIHHDDHDVPLGPLPRTDGVFLCTNPRHLPWGTVDLAMCLLETTRWVHRHLAVEWVSTLSGQDWPVVPLEVSERRLADADVDGFVDAKPLGWSLRGRPAGVGATSEDWLMLRRYLFRYYALPFPRPAALTRRGVVASYEVVGDAPKPVPLSLRIKRRLAECNLRSRFAALSEVPDPWSVGIRRVRHPFDAAHPVWYGSCWYDLSRRAMDRMLTTLEPGRPLHRYFQQTEIADEAMFATVLCNDRSLRIDHEDNHRYLRWETWWSPSPNTLGKNDLDGVMASGATFARKFDDDRDRGIVELLEDRRSGGERPRNADGEKAVEAG